MPSALPVLPVLLPLLAAAVLPLVPPAVRGLPVLLAPLLALVVLCLLPAGTTVQASVAGQALVPVLVQPTGQVFAGIFALALLAGGLFALRQEKTAELSAALVYGGAAIGVALAGDLLSLFFFWELMTLASLAIIWLQGSEASRAAGLRYLLVHLLGGVLLLAGIAGHVAAGGSLMAAPPVETPAWWLMLAGVLVNAGAPPLAGWLADAYPEASWSGTVFLSAFTTKAAVLVLLRYFAGAEVLLWVGLAMVCYGILYALLENDIRRILVFSLVSQVGYMVIAAGVGTPLAIDGATAQAVAHILYKALLLMTAGVVIRQTGLRRCSDLGGLYRSMPLTAAAAVVGGLTIAAVPLTSGFASKALILEAVAATGHAWLWFPLEAASALGFLYVGLRFPWFVFFAPRRTALPAGSGISAGAPSLSRETLSQVAPSQGVLSQGVLSRGGDLERNLPAEMKLAMGLLALSCLAIGLWPSLLYQFLPSAEARDFIPWHLSHVLHQLQLLLAGVLVFFLSLPWLTPRATLTLEPDWLWRRLAGQVLALFAPGSYRVRHSLAGLSLRALERSIAALVHSHGPAGVLARTWETSTVALWIVALLGAALVGYYSL